MLAPYASRHPGHGRGSAARAELPPARSRMWRLPRNRLEGQDGRRLERSREMRVYDDGSALGRKRWRRSTQTTCNMLMITAYFWDDAASWDESSGRTHGKRATYNAGCRCGRCSKANREFHRLAYHKRKARTRLVPPRGRVVTTDGSGPGGDTGSEPTTEA